MKLIISLFCALFFSQLIFAQEATINEGQVTPNGNVPATTVTPRTVTVEERVDINDGADKQAQIKRKREKFYPLNTSLATTIITREHIKSSGARNLADALKSEFGPRVIETGTSAVAGIRGTKAQQVMVLVNGMQLNNVQGFAVDLKSIPAYNIERIEIIRGGASSRFGANAVGGVINVITVDKVDTFKGVENVIGYGSYDVFSLSTLMAKSVGTNNQGTLFASGLFSTSDGNFDYSIDTYDVLGNKDKYEGGLPNNKTLKANGYASFYYNLNNTDVLHFDVSAIADNKEIPNSYDENFDGDFGKQNQEVQRYSFNFTYDNNSLKAFNLTLKVGAVHEAKKYRSNDDIGTDESYNNITSLGSIYIDRIDNFYGVFTFKNDIELHYKNEYFHTYWERADFFTGKRPNDVMRHTASIAYLPELSFPSFQDTDIPRFTIYPAFRFDSSIVLDAKNALPYFTPAYSLGFLYSFDKDRRYNIKANFGTGYRLPGFDDLYPATNDFVKPPYGEDDSTLLREESMYGDVGFIISPIDMIRIEGFYHIQKVRDMIVWIQHPTDLYNMAVNIEGAFFHGGEASLLFSLPIKPALSRFEIKANYLYQFGIAIGEYVQGKLIPKIPTHSVGGKISYIFEGTDKVGFRVDGFANYMTKTYNDLLNEEELPSVLLVDVTGSVTFLKTFTLEGGVKNILDTKYEHTKGYLQPGREWYAAIRGKF